MGDVGRVDIVIEKGIGNIFCKLVTKNIDINEIVEAIYRHTDYAIYPDSEMSISELLRAIYRYHHEFYNDINYEYTTHDHPEDYDFNEGCSGFKNFLKKYFRVERLIDLSDDDLLKLSTIIANRIAYLYCKYINKLETVVTATSSVHFAKETKSIKLSEPEILNDAIIVSNTGVYTVKLVKVDNIKSYNDIKTEIIDAIKRNYEAQLNAIIKSYKSRIKALEEKVIETKEQAFTEALNTIEQVLEKGWTVENGELVLYKKIYVDKLKYQRVVYQLPKEYINEFYIENIRIPITAKVTKAQCDYSYHPNASDGSICLGDLEGKDLKTVVTELPKILKIANLDSAYPNDATKEAEDIVEELYLDRNYITEEVFNSDDE